MVVGRCVGVFGMVLVLVLVLVGGGRAVMTVP